MCVRQLYLGILLLPMLLMGCSSVSYYSQSISGHLELMNRVEPIDEVLARETTQDDVRQRLERALELRAFASDSLGLPDNDSYKSYADLQRPYVVWTVVVTPRFSVTPQTSCFLIVGCLSYRGYFSQEEAERYAEQERVRGMDVYVGGTQAYSTLGWFNDPLLNTMLNQPEVRLAEVLIHELAHQLLYMDDDSAFNEAFATAVAQEGVRRWLSQTQPSEVLQAYETSLQRREDFNRLLLATREKLAALYQSPAGEADKRIEKAAIFKGMKTEYAKLKLSWGGYAGYDRWMGRELNNAHLALVATYHERVPAFQALLERLEGQLPVFYLQVEKLSALPKAERETELVKLAER